MVKRHGVTEFLQVFEDFGQQFFSLETDMLVMLDRNGNICRVNPAFETLTGYAESDVLGHGVTHFVDLNDLGKFLNAFTAVKPSPFRMLHKGGGLVTMRLVSWRHRANKSYIILRRDELHD